MEAGGHLVGRDDSLDRLRVALDDALRGQGTVMLVAGEAGIGKTALLGALADEAAARSVSVAWGQCWDDSMVPAFWPWTQVLRDLDRTTDPSSMIGLLTHRSHAVAEETVDRFELFDAVRRELIEASTSSGLLVVIDDLHWADEATLALLAFLVRHVRRTRLLIVGAFRDVDATRPIAGLLGRAEMITLDALATDDAADVARSVAAGRLAPNAIADVVRRAGGNPLFVRELTRLVAAARHASPVQVPGGVREVVAQRLVRLSPGCRRMLDVAAVAGAQARVDVLTRMLGGRDDFAELVSEAVQARIVTPPDTQPSHLVFVHDLFREVLSAMLSPAIRGQLHLAIGRTLDELRAGGAPIPQAPVAAHYVAAATLGVQPAALDAVRRSDDAATEAIGQLAFEDAAGHLRRALSALPLADGPDPRVRLDLLLRLGDTLDQAGDATGARQALLEASDLARQIGDIDRSARAAIGVHRLGALSGLSRDQNVRLLEEAVSGLTGNGSPLRARALASLARELHHTWDPATADRARTVAAEATVIARELDDPGTLAFCLLALHDVNWSVGSASARVPIVAEMRELAESAGDSGQLAQAHLLDATALLELGDPRAPRALERYCRAAEGLGHARGRWGALSRRAVLALLAGQFDEAAALGSAAARLGEEIGEPDAPAVRDTLWWELARFRDGWSGFVAEEHWVPPGNWPPIRAVLLLARGEQSAARSVLAGYSLDHDRRHGVRRHDGWMPMIITEAVTAVGSAAQQVEVYEWLRPLAGHHLVYGGCMGYGGAVDHHLAALAASLGRHDDAVMHRRAALAMHETLGAVAWAELDRALLVDDSRATATPTSAVDHGNVLRREGDVWRVTFRGRSSTLRHVKGLLDLAVLLDRPGREVPALELMGGSDVGGAPGPVLDDHARRTYQGRIRDLQRELDEARAGNDWVRAERAEVALDALLEQLSQAFGLGGRNRAGGGAAERARAAVTHRLRSAIRRIGDVDPALGQHLLNAVKTGTFCSYQPDVDIEWTVQHDRSG